MKKIMLFALCLGSASVALASVAPSETIRTPVDVVDISSKEIWVDVPAEIDYDDELDSENLGRLNELEGVEDAKYMRGIVKKLRDNPEKIMHGVYGMQIQDIDMEHYNKQKALGTDRDALGINMKDGKKVGHWSDSLNDVRLPDYPGDYDDLSELKEELKTNRNEGIKKIKKMDIDKIQRSAPIMQIK